MKKADLISAVAEKTQISKKDVESVISTVFDTIVDSMKQGEIVDIYGFGKFEGVYKEAHTARNPLTGEEKVVAAKRNPKLRYSSAVKRLINE